MRREVSTTAGNPEMMGLEARRKGQEALERSGSLVIVLVAIQGRKALFNCTQPTNATQHHHYKPPVTLACLKRSCISQTNSAVEVGSNLPSLVALLDRAMREVPWYVSGEATG